MSKLLEVNSKRQLELFPLKERQKHLENIREEYKRTIVVALLAKSMMERALALDDLIPDRKDPKKMKLSQRGAIVSKIQEHTETIANSYKALDQIETGDVIAKSAE